MEESHIHTGRVGEDIAEKWLRKKGFKIIDRNYRKKWGEIDIVARGTNKTHFVEVKTVSHETKKALDTAVSHGTWRPEENVHDEKLRRLGRAIETWIVEHTLDGDWQIDVITVRMVPDEKYAQVGYIENVILE